MKLHSDMSDRATWHARADQGDAEAQFNLALMYYNAEGVEQSDAQAAEWFTAAAEQGHAKAQFNLGALYANGHGVAQSFATAYRLWLMASLQGDYNATENLAMMRAKVTDAEADAGQTAATEWFNRQLTHHS